MNHFRSFSNLYFQFIRDTEFDGILEWYHVAECFAQAGLIEFVPSNVTTAFEGYRETPAMRNLDEATFNQVTKSFLVQYTVSKGLRRLTHGR